MNLATLSDIQLTHTTNLFCEFVGHYFHQRANFQFLRSSSQVRKHLLGHFFYVERVLIATLNKKNERLTEIKVVQQFLNTLPIVYKRLQL